MIPWLGLSVLILIIVLGIFFIFNRKKKSCCMNMRGFYLIGLVFAIIGIMGDNVLMWRMGILFLILGLFHKDKIIKSKKKR
jgi:hypothetical protein